MDLLARGIIQRCFCENSSHLKQTAFETFLQMSPYSLISIRNFLISLAPSVNEAWENLRLYSFLKNFRKTGWKGPLPGLIKRYIILAEIRRIHATTLIETGAYMGDTPWFFRKKLAHILSIEVQSQLASLATKRFRRWPNITIIDGDSGRVLDKILPTLKDSTVFWLDGHFSAGITGTGSRACPLIDELNAIFRLCSCKHTILIDDFRLLGNDPMYPTIAELTTFASDHNRTIRWENDIIYVEGSHKDDDTTN